MKIDDVLATYNARYAAEYDETFLHDTWSRESLAFQMRTLEGLLAGARSWLDVACGTGWALSQFPQIQRAGLDISPPMLELARSKNPDVLLVEGDYRLPRPEWNDQWDVVSCMWWAYCLAETMSEIRALVAQLADWTSPQGRVFVPLCNPNKFDRHNIRVPFVDPKVPGRLMITGITWTWIQVNGARHDNVLVPQVDYLVMMFREHFEHVEVIQGDIDVVGEGWLVQDVLVAHGKKPVRERGDLYANGRSRPPGQSEWLLWTQRGAQAHVEYLTPDFDTIRVVVEQLDGPAPASVRISKLGLPVPVAGAYDVVLRVRASHDRSIAVRVDSKARATSVLQLIHCTAEWKEFVLSAGPGVDVGTDVDLHLDVGQAQSWIELTGAECRSR